MERRVGERIEAWDDADTKAQELKLPQELDPNTIGNVRRGIEDQLEQKDNMLNGIIDNLPYMDDVKQEIKNIAELQKESDTLFKELSEYVGYVDMYMLSSGGESDYFDGMVDNIKAMEVSVKELDNEIERRTEVLKKRVENTRPEKSHYEKSLNIGEKKSVIKQLQVLKPELVNKTHKAVTPELVL